MAKKRIFIILLCLANLFTLANAGWSDGETFSADVDSQHALELSAGSASYNNITVTKTGGPSGRASDNYDFYGTNAAILASGGASLTISGSSTTITTNANYANAVFSYGSGTTVTISDASITTTASNSGGIMTTGGGIMNASNLTITTSGSSSAAIRTDRGGGTVNVNGGTYATSGQGSPAIYSTAKVTASDVTLKSNTAQAVVIEGGNSVTLTNSTLTANHKTLNGQDKTHQAILIYQSMSGDASDGTSSFTMSGGNLTNSEGDIFCVTNTTCTITLESVDITNNDTNGNFLRAEAQNWGNSGNNGGKVTFNTSAQKISGNIITDANSTLALNLSNGSSFTGAINSSGNASVTLDSSSTWTLTANSSVSSFTKNSGKVYGNGYTLTVNGTPYTAIDDAPTAPGITTSALPDGMLGETYSQTLTASGTTPINWSLKSGNLPTGLTLYSSGLISGTPTATGSFDFVVLASNAVGNADKSFTIKVDEEIILTPPSITTSALPDGMMGKEYSADLFASGSGPVTWSLRSGNIPNGLTLYSSGLISGIPIRSGDFTFSVIAVNSAGSDDIELTITIEEDNTVIPPAITTVNLDNGTVRTKYNVELEASGTEPITWSLESGELPDGLQLYASGTISGTPSRAGTFTFSVNATNPGGNDTREFTITISASGGTGRPVTIKTTSFKEGKVGKSYTVTLKASGSGTITWEAEGLPEGLTLNSKTGKIKGRPEEAGTYDIDIIASNETNSADVSLELVVVDVKPKIKASLPNGIIGLPYSATFSLSAGTGDVQWELEGDLPAGLEFDEDSLTITGTPEEAFNNYITITATNTGGTATKRLRLKVKGVKPTIASKTFRAGIVGEDYSESVFVTGTEPITVSIANLPDGLEYSDGEISGTPTRAGTFKIKITAKSDYGSANRSVKMNFAAKPEITTSTIYEATAGKRYTFRFSASGSDTIKWFYAGGTLPEGMSINSKGLLKGTPNAPGTYNFAVGAYNNSGTDTKEFELLVESALRDDEALPESKFADELPDNPLMQLLNVQNDFTDFAGGFAWISGDYEVVAELEEVSVDVEGMYEFEFILNDDVPEGAKLIWLANSSSPSEDDEIAEFYDFDGAEIDAVPEERLITVSAWLNEGVIYKPALAVKKK